ncbi:MAG: RHS repeat protein [Gammaproteobacteria bacterium]|nr:RHS repeat protein [Gammaproteobacteria bacterium]
MNNVIHATDMNTAAAYTVDRVTSLLPAAGLRVIACGQRAANDEGLTPHTPFNYDALNRRTRKTDALLGVTHYQYDPNGNRTAEIDALNHTRRLAYDALNRLTQRTDANGFDTNLVYDAVGNLLTEVNTTDPATAVTDNLNTANNVVYAFDANGNQISKTQGTTVTNFGENGTDLFNWCLYRCDQRYMTQTIGMLMTYITNTRYLR